MLNVIEQHVEASHKESVIPQYEIPEITVCSHKETAPVNYLKQLHRCGIRKNDHVLVVGAADVEMLKKLAELVGQRGKITVIDNDPIAIARVKDMVDASQFKAFKPFTGGHPAFDLRAPSKKHTPVEVTIEPLTSGSLLFADDQFDVTWIEHQSLELTGSEAELFLNELKRVTNGAIIRPGV